MSLRHALCCVVLCLVPSAALCQLASAPEPQKANISGFAADVDDAAIPGATITVDGPTPADHFTHVADEVGFFELTGLQPAVVYHVTLTAKGFAADKLADVTLMPGQLLEIKNIHMVPEVLATVDAVTPEEMAVEQVHEEEQQRILGFIPNFYVVYAPSQDVPPLSASLKFKLAIHAATDPVTFGGAIFLAAIDQAADTPGYVQGAKGFGQRIGANYLDGLTDVFIGGAIMPALLRQDPRYFYLGPDGHTKKQRFWHAVAAPFICRGDNGRQQFNFSSVFGDLSSGAISEVYYPPVDRGYGLVFSNAAITTAGRMVNALAQEFVLGKLTTRGKTR